MTQTVIDALEVLVGEPSLEALGGEDLIYASHDALVSDSRVVEVAAALCGEWDNLHSPGTAASLLMDAASAATVLSARDLFDVMLTSEQALPTLAADLEGVLRERAKGAGMARDLALEAWTRLALGGWATKENALRAALEEGVEHGDATHSLVRALGAGLTHWQDKGLRTALESLVEHDELDADAAMELGIDAIVRAVGQEDMGAVRDGLQDALRYLDVARSSEERTDAVAFDAVIAGVLDQTAGITVSADRLEKIKEHTYAYLDGYTGVHGGWRSARAYTTTAWLELLADLQQAATDRWYNPPRTIASLARTLAAETTLTLVVHADDRPHHGVAALVSPHISSIVSGNSEILAHIARWLGNEGTSATPELRESVERLQTELEETPPKHQRESSHLDRTIRDRLHLSEHAADVVAAAVASTPELLPLLDRWSVFTVPPTLTEEKLLDDLLTACDTHADGGIAGYRSDLTGVILHLLRFTSFHLNEGQNGDRAAPWFASRKAKKTLPQEHELADDLNASLNMARFDSQVERANVAGGRVDIAIAFPRYHVYLEVKRTGRNRSDSQLVEDYGAQAVQYAGANIPVAFLIVADYSHRKTRLDLPAVVTVAPVQLDGASRVYALTTVRVQANVDVPSASSVKIV